MSSLLKSAQFLSHLVVIDRTLHWHDAVLDSSTPACIDGCLSSGLAVKSKRTSPISPARLHGQELGHPTQIDDNHRQGEGLAYLIETPQLRLMHAAMLLGISKHRLQQLPNGHADAVSRMPCRARVDRASPVGGVLRHVRGHVDLPTAFDK